MVYWTVLLTSCILLTICGTLVGKRPMLAAVGVSVLVSLGLGLSAARIDPFWGLASVIVLICSLPVTIVTAIVTENLRDKYASRRKGS